jgi:hypothetical protein
MYTDSLEANGYAPHSYTRQTLTVQISPLYYLTVLLLFLFNVSFMTVFPRLNELHRSLTIDTTVDPGYTIDTVCMLEWWELSR